MLILAVFLLSASFLAALVWASRHLMIRTERRTGFQLTGDYAGPPTDAPRLSIFVAAKDEQAVIERCVSTLLEQDYPNFEVVVANDRSADDTGPIVRRLAEADPRVRLLDIKHLPLGWCGKNNAMQTAIATSDSEWFVMADADCWQTSPRTLSVAMQYALDHKVDLLSVLPNLAMEGFWENVIQPVCSGVMMIWFHPDKVNSPRKRNAYANGAFMLMRREAWRAVGTHEAVRDRVNEDMHLAALVKGQGLSLRVVRNQSLYKVRMYTSLKQIVRGWGRIFFGTFGTVRRLAVALTVLVVMGLLPYISAGLGLTLYAAGADNAGWWLAAGLVGATAAALQVSVIFRFYALIGARKWLAWTYPLGSAMAFVCCAIALSKLRKGATVTWRGTHYARPGASN